MEAGLLLAARHDHLERTWIAGTSARSKASSPPGHDGESQRARHDGYGSVAAADGAPVAGCRVELPVMVSNRLASRHARPRRSFASRRRCGHPRRPHPAVMPGFVPGIHVLHRSATETRLILAARTKNVDGRD